MARKKKRRRRRRRRKGFVSQLSLDRRSQGEEGERGEMEGERERGIGGEVDIRIMYVRFPGFGGGEWRCGDWILFFLCCCCCGTD